MLSAMHRGISSGILPQATEFAPALTLSNRTPIDRLRLAVLQAVLAEYPASGLY
ncbi:hypothetical protein [Klebsiella michiganensis]|uniref:hypothetical protein n=1 Tax=Klebsiella michiganensis TaxID=1134687 RepID=UPI001D0D2E59|nr:hypothetical protein [Klebsiella michiganensis]